MVLSGLVHNSLLALEVCFFTKEACESSNQVALTFRSSDQAKAAQTDDDNIPDSVLELLESDTPEDDDGGVVETVEAESDSELLKELEEALEDIQ